MINLLLILAGCALVLLNAFFVAAEFGMVKLRHTRVAIIALQHPWRGKILLKVHKHLDSYLSACQLGITLASLGLGWIGEPIFSFIFSPILVGIGVISPNLIELFTFFLAFVCLTFLHIVIGELMPKSLAIRKSEQISLWTAGPLYIFYWIMYPIIWVLNSCSNFFLKRLGLDVISPNEQYHSSEEIKLILHSSQVHGELSLQEGDILARTLELGDLCVIDVMRPYDDMIMLDSQLVGKELYATLNHYRYSRYPAYDGAKKQIIGILHVKDLQTLWILKKDERKISLKKLIRPVPKISYRLPALALLHQFQKGMPHFALVYGRQGAIVGFVTLDNVLLLAIGVIQDEFHKTQDSWIKNVDNSLTLTGECSINALERALQKELNLTTEEEAKIATVSDLILSKLHHVPHEGEELTFTHFKTVIEKIHDQHIKRVRIIPFTSR